MSHSSGNETFMCGNNSIQSCLVLPISRNNLCSQNKSVGRHLYHAIIAMILFLSTNDGSKLCIIALYYVTFTSMLLI